MSTKSDQITLQELISRLKDYLLFLWSKKLWFLVFAAAFAIVLVAYNGLKTKKYTATTSFVLENGGAGLGDLSSLASLAGVNLGGALSESNDLFQIDNIQELYRSHRMISETMLTEAPFRKGGDLLVNKFIEQNELREEWEGEQGLENISFSIPREQFTIQHDSLLLEFTDMIREDYLAVSKPNRKLSILNVNVTDEYQEFAKRFNDALVQNVNSFYTKTRTKKSGENLAILQKQADSVKLVLEAAMLRLAQVQESAPNRNPLYKTPLVEEQKLMVDIAASSAMYETVVKNLEIAKVSHRSKMPLIQIIDYPILPLKDNQWKLFKAIVVGGFIGGFLALVYFTGMRMLRAALKEEEYQ
ncbi:exopolysaccharide biosynthesis protein [Roseivirga pacifica]|uniref:exopolysaccharide biosynthesis protein n=1 Tax=Roseivirga pacifica TaxID=1267423 RepID=UPI003BAC1313